MSTSHIDIHTSTDIRRGSKSFSLASRMFPKTVRYNVHSLYAWCRYCDDLIDRNTDSTRNLELLRKQLVVANSNEDFPDNFPQETKALRELFADTPTSFRYANELLDGMQMDAENFQYKNENELILYCYRVAGTVGLMMCNIMGVKNTNALSHATHLGIAMQLTNIARDIAEDASLGRVYFPETWLTDYGVNKQSILELSANKTDIFKIIIHTLELADNYYRSGLEGLKFLPFRASIAVLAASQIYAEIGNNIRAMGPNGIGVRAIVSKRRKIKLLLISILDRTYKRTFHGTV